MRCPYCASEETKVLASRQAEEGTAIRRRRECERCFRRFTTFEKYEEMPLIVIKKDGSRQEFSKTKLMAGILRACEKRPITTAQIEDIVYTIEKDIRNLHEREISSQEIGEAVMSALLDLDEVAYIRFASVYRQFSDIQRFLQELQELNEKKKRKVGESVEF